MARSYNDDPDYDEIKAGRLNPQDILKEQRATNTQKQMDTAPAAPESRTTELTKAQTAVNDPADFDTYREGKSELRSAGLAAPIRPRLSDRAQEGELAAKEQAAVTNNTEALARDQEREAAARERESAAADRQRASDAAKAQRGVMRNFKSAGGQTEFDTEGNEVPKLQTNPQAGAQGPTKDGAPINEPAAVPVFAEGDVGDGPYTAPDGRWKKKWRDKLGNEQEIDLEANRELHTDAETGARWINWKGKKIDAGRDENVVERNKLKITQLDLDRDSQEERLHLKDARDRRQIAQEAVKPFSAQVTTAEKTIENLERSLTTAKGAGRTVLEQRIAEQRKVLADPNYLAAKSALETVDGEIQTRETSIYQRELKSLEITRNLDKLKAARMLPPVVDHRAMAGGMADAQGEWPAEAIKTDAGGVKSIDRDFLEARVAGLTTEQGPTAAGATIDATRPKVGLTNVRGYASLLENLQANGIGAVGGRPIADELVAAKAAEKRLDALGLTEAKIRTGDNLDFAKFDALPPAERGGFINALPPERRESFTKGLATWRAMDVLKSAPAQSGDLAFAALNADQRKLVADVIGPVGVKQLVQLGSDRAQGNAENATNAVADAEYAAKNAGGKAWANAVALFGGATKGMSGLVTAAPRIYGLMFQDGPMKDRAGIQWADAADAILDDTYLNGRKGSLADGAGNLIGTGLSFFVPGGIVGTGVRLLGIGAKSAQYATLATTSLVGAALNGASSIAESSDLGLTEKETWTRFAIAAGLGTTEALGIGKGMERLVAGLIKVDRGTRGSLKNLLIGMGRESVKELPEETLQEGGQTLFTGLGDMAFGIETRTDAGTGERRAPKFSELIAESVEAGMQGAAGAVLFGSLFAGIAHSRDRQRLRQYAATLETDGGYAVMHDVLGELRGKLQTARAEGREAEVHEIKDQIEQAQFSLLAAAKKVTALNPDQRQKAAALIGAEVDAAGMERQLEENETLRFAAAEIGASLRDIYLPGERQTAAATVLGPGAGAQVALDQMIGTHAVQRDLVGVLEGGQIEGNKAAAFDRLGLLELDPQDDGTTIYRVTDDALALLPKALREAVANDADGKYNFKVTAGQPGALVNNLVKSGEDRLRTAAESKNAQPAATRATAPASSGGARFKVNLQVKLPGGVTRSQSVEVDAANVDEAAAIATAQARSSAPKGSTITVGGTVVSKAATRTADATPKADNVDEDGAGREFGAVFQAWREDLQKFGVTKLVEARDGKATVQGVDLEVGGPMALANDTLIFNRAQIAELINQRKDATTLPGAAIEQVLVHELIHSVANKVITNEQAEEIARTAPVKLRVLAMKAYANFEELSDYQKGHEMLRLVVEGRYRGKITEQIYQALQALLDALGVRIKELPENELLQRAADAVKQALDAAQVDIGGSRVDSKAMGEADVTGGKASASAAFEIATPQGGVKVRGQWRVVEASEMTTSDRPNYNGDLQRRQRDRSASKAQIAEIAFSLDPTRLGESATSDTGSPIVNAKGEVLSGNGRSMALRSVYEQGGKKAGEYRAFVLEQAEKLGIAEQLEGLRNPVLVREVSEFGKSNEAEFAELSNRSALLGRSAVETAMDDGKMLISEGLLDAFDPGENGEIFTASNRQFNRLFIQHTADRAQLLRGDGSFSPDLEGRVRRAILAAILQKLPEATEAVTSAIERADKLGLARQVNGIMAAAGRLLKLQTTNPEMDIAAPLAEALAGAIEAKGLIDAGKARGIEDALGQGVLFGEPSPAAQLLVRELLSRTSAKGVRELLTEYARIAESAASGPSMFGDEAPGLAPVDVLTNIINQASREKVRLAAARGLQEALGAARIEQESADAGNTEGVTAALFASRVAPKDLAALFKSAAKEKGPIDIAGGLDVAGHPGLFGRGLGVKRADMPQVPGDKKAEFLKWLEQRGVKHTAKTVNALTLKPTQAELDAVRIGRLIGHSEGDRPGFVSNDGYVVDGHHRWGATIAEGFTNGRMGMKVTELDVPIREALRLTREFNDEKGIEVRPMGATTFGAPALGAGRVTDTGTMDLFAVPEVASAAQAYVSAANRSNATVSKKEFKRVAKKDGLGEMAEDLFAFGQQQVALTENGTAGNVSTTNGTSRRPSNSRGPSGSGQAADGGVRGEVPRPDAGTDSGAGGGGDSVSSERAGDGSGSDAGGSELTDGEIAEALFGTREPIDPDARNFRIPDGATVAPKGNAAKYAANLEAIRLLKTIEAGRRLATPEEKAVLARYTGWGWAGEYFNPDNAKFAKQHGELRALLTEDEFTSARASTTNAHYTALPVIDAMWSIAERLGFKGGRVLEPAGGVGHFFGRIPERLARRVRLAGVELDSVSGRMLDLLYPEAEIQNTGFEAAKLPNHFYDLAISNVPFGSYTVPGAKDYPKLLIHDYFFARTLDKVRPGGLVVFITSDGTMDKGDKAVRALLAEKADLVGAIRLPNTAFAENAGTEVTTDLIVLRKKDGTPFRGAEWLGRREVGRVPIVEDGKTTERAIAVNQYYADHPEMALGEHSLQGTMYGSDDYALVPKKGQDLGALLDAAIARLPANLYEIDGAGGRSENEGALASSGTKEGEYVLEGDEFFQAIDGRLAPAPWLTLRNFGDRFEERIDDKTLRERKLVAEDWLGLREAVVELIDAETQPGVDVGRLAAMRVKLNNQYDRYVRRWGTLTKRFRHLERAAFLEDDPQYPLLQSIENEVVRYDADGKKKLSWEKADIFRKRTREPRIMPTTAATVEDAVNVALSFEGRITPATVARLLGIDEEAATRRIIESGRAFKNPGTGMLESRERYLSGNVREKLKSAEAVVDEGDAFFNANVDALRAALPKDIPLSGIYLGLASRWLPAEVTTAFASELLGTTARVQYVRSANRYSVTLADNETPENVTTHGTKDFKGRELLIHALNGTEPQVMKPKRDANGNVVTRGENHEPVMERDDTATQMARTKVAAIQKRFGSWVKTTTATIPQLAADASAIEDRSVQEVVERVYNDTQNAMVAPFYSGDYLVDMVDGKPVSRVPGLSSAVWMNPHRRSVVARILQDGSAVMAHGVGSGKTFSQIVAAMEMRRIGLAKKPLIVVQKATIGQFAKSVREAYPGARALVATEKTFSKNNRRRFLARIATGDYDMVIVTQPQFDRLLPGRRLVKVYFEDRLAALEEAIRAAKAAEGKRDPKTKELESAKKRLEAKMKRMLDGLQSRGDDMLAFEQLGIDAMFIDEAHAYKKTSLVTNMRRVKGIPNDESQRAMGLEIKAEYIQEQNNGRNVVLATGTPITNSMAESYIMLKLATPHVLKEYGIENFDEFAHTFGQTQTKLEYSWGGKWKLVSRFNKFVNGAELITMIRSGFDVKMGNKALGLKVPRMVHESGEDKPEILIIPQTPAMDAVSAWITRIATEYETVMKKGSTEEKQAAMAVPIVTMQAGMAAALDPRLVAPGAEDAPGSKVNTAVRRVVELWKESADQRGAQVIFADRFKPMNVSLLESFAGGADVSIDTDETDDAGAELGEGEEAAEGNNELAAVEDSEFRSAGFNLYFDIREKLIAAGIPRADIAIIHEYGNDQKRADLFEAINEGRVRVVIGSTEKLGVGVNMQRKLFAAHHLDPPRQMTPAMMEQRDGRIIRQGNTFEAVYNLRYGVERSMDTGIYQMLENKGRFIAQALSGLGVGRTFDDAADELTMSMAEMKAKLTGDTRVLRLAELQGEMQELENELGGFENEKSAQARKRASLLSEVRWIQTDRLPHAEQLQAWLPGHFEGETWQATIDGREFSGERKDLADALDSALRKGALRAVQSRDNTGKTPATIEGVPVVLFTHLTTDGKNVASLGMLTKSPIDGRELRQSSISNGSGALQSLQSLRRAYDGHADELRTNLQRAQEQIATIDAEMVKPWERQAEYDAKSSELKSIETALLREARAENEDATPAAEVLSAARVAPDPNQEQFGFDRARAPVGAAAPSVAELVRDNMGLAVTIANSYRNIPGEDFDNVLGEARKALVMAARGFEPGRAEFGAYAGRAIRNTLNNLYNKEARRALREVTIADSDAGGANGEGGPSLKDQLEDPGAAAAVSGGIEGDETRAAIAEAMAGLPERVRTVLTMHGAGAGLREIGAAIGLSHEMARRILANGTAAMAVRLRERGFAGVDPDGVLFAAAVPGRAAELTADAEMAESGGERQFALADGGTVVRAGGEARRPYLADVWRLYENSYRTIGMQYANAEEMMAEPTLFDVVQAAGRPAAFQVRKVTPWGYKGVASGSDGTAEGKLAWRQAHRLLQEQGYYSELSGAPRFIAEKESFPVVPAAEAALILSKPIEPLPGGKAYLRSIRVNDVTLAHEKCMFGKPLLWKSNQPTETSSTASRPRSTIPPLPTRSERDSAKNLEALPPDRSTSSLPTNAGNTTRANGAEGELLSAAAIAEREIAEESDRILNPPTGTTERPQEFLKELLMRTTAGRIDALDFVVPGTKNLLTDAQIKNARISAALRIFRERIEENVKQSFGYPSWWRQPANRDRLAKFTAELLPTAARLNAVGQNASGAFQFESFWMRAGEIGVKLDGNGRPDLTQKAMGINGVPVTLRQGVFIAGRHGEKLRAGRMVDTITAGRRRVFWQLERFIPGNEQAQIHASFHARYPEAAHWLDSWINPNLRESRVEIGGIDLPDFNRFSLREFWGEISPFGEVGEVKGYTPDIFRTKSLVGMLTGRVRDLLNRTWTGPGREYKSGEARERGDVRNLFEGWNARAAEAHMETERRRLAEALLKKALVPIPETGAPSNFVRWDAETIDELLRSYHAVQGLDPAQYQRLKEQVRRRMRGNKIDPDQAEFQTMLGQLREEYPALAEGDVIAFLQRDPDGVAAEQMANDQTLLPGTEAWGPRARELWSGANSSFSAEDLARINQLAGRVAAEAAENRDKMIHRTALAELRRPLASQFINNGLLRLIDAGIRGATGGYLASLFTLATNQISNELFVTMHTLRRALYGLFSLPSDRRQAKLGLYEAGILLKGVVTDRWYSKRVRELVPDELFDGNHRFNTIATDEFEKSPAELLRELNVSGALLKAMRYGNVDTRAKQRIAFASYMAHGRIAWDEAKAAGKVVPGVKRGAWIRDWIENLAPDSVHRSAYYAAMLVAMDYMNVPPAIDETNQVMMGGRDVTAEVNMLRRGVAPFAKFPYNMARQGKRYTFDSLREILPGNLKVGSIELTKGATTSPAQKRQAAANLVMMGMMYLLARAMMDDDDEGVPKLGRAVDDLGKRLEGAYNTAGRINITDSPIGRTITAALDMMGLHDMAEQEQWLRVRALPYASSAVALATVEQAMRGRAGGGDMEANVTAVLSDMVSEGLMLKMLNALRDQKGPYDKDKNLSFIAGETIFDTATGRFLPPPLLRTANALIDPVQRRSRPVASLEYDPGLVEAVQMKIPGGARNLPPAGRVVIGASGSAKSEDAVAALLAAELPEGSFRRYVDAKGNAKVAYVMPSKISVRPRVLELFRAAGLNVKFLDGEEYASELAAAD